MYATPCGQTVVGGEDYIGALKTSGIVKYVRGANGHVEQGPDGHLYFTTEVRYGSGKPDGTIIRLEPGP